MDVIESLLPRRGIDLHTDWIRISKAGQKDVTVYRLISKGTIEERILERQRAKQSLADEVIGADAAGFKDLSKEELMGLFRLDSGDQSL